MRGFHRGLTDLLPPMRAHARGLTGSMAVGDALVQAALARALASPPGLVPNPARLRAWMFTILRGCWEDTERDRVAALSIVPVGPATLAMGLERLAEAIVALPAAEREALLLVGAQGLTAAEAGAICGVGAPLIRARVGRARRALRLALPVTKAIGAHADRNAMIGRGGVMLAPPMLMKHL